MTYTPFVSAKDRSVVDFKLELERNVLDVSREIYEDMIEDYRRYLETSRPQIYIRKVRPMKETKQTLKFRLCDIRQDLFRPYNREGRLVTQIRGLTLEGGEVKISGICDDMRSELGIALDQRLEAEITITIKRPETKLEEVERVQHTLGKAQALEKAKEYLAGVK